MTTRARKSPSAVGLAFWPGGIAFYGGTAALAGLVHLGVILPPPAPRERALEPEAPPLPERLERLKREVVAMRFFDGLDYRSIAELTGRSEVTLRSRMHDALERLRGVLARSE